MLGDSKRTSVAHPSKATSEYPSKASECIDHKVTAESIVAPPKSSSYSQQKENISTTPLPNRVPTPESSFQSPSSGFYKRNFTDTESPHELQAVKRACSALRERVDRPDNSSHKVGLGSFDKIKAVIDEIEPVKPGEITERHIAAVRKPKARKLLPASQVTDPPTPQGFAKFMKNTYNTTSSPSGFAIDPLQCNEHIVEPEDFSDFAIDPLQCNEHIVEPEDFSGTIPTPVEHNIKKVMTPLAYPSTGPSGIATPTRDPFPKKVVDLDKVSENLQKIVSTSDFGLMIHSEPALILKNMLPPSDLPLFDSSFRIWMNDIKAEDTLSQKTNPDCLERHPEITALSRWVVINWFREVCVEYLVSRQTFQSAVLLLDICLSNFDFDPENFQLVAATALFIASKIHDTVQFNIGTLIEFVWDDDRYTTQQNQASVESAKRFLLKHEFKMMKLMNWNVIIPSPLDFLRHSFQYAAIYEDGLYNHELPGDLFDSRSDRGNDTVLHQKYDTMLFARAAAILDRAIMDIDYLNFLGSQIAASVFWIVYPVGILPEYAKELLLVSTGYQLNEIIECIDFVRPYKDVTDQDIIEILEGDTMTQVFQNSFAYGSDFKLEEHQLPGIMMPVHYDNILANRAKKLGKPHSLSYWQFE